MVNRRNFFNLGDTSSIPAAFSDVTNPISQYDFGEYEDMVMAEDGTLVPRSFYDVMDLGEFENPIETAAFQIQMAGSMNPEALAATEGMLTPYGPGLTVDEIEGIAEEYIGISSGISLNDELELFNDADALYDNPVFGKAYSTVVERAKGAGLDMNDLQTAINVLQNAGQAIGYKTVPSDLYGVNALPFETDLSSTLSLAPDIGIDNEAFTEFIGTIADESSDKYIKQSSLNNFTEAARIQSNTSSGVLPETALNIFELEQDLKNINTSEMLEELYATEGQQAVQRFISNPDSYSSGQLSLEATRDWVDGVVGDSEGALRSAFQIADNSFTESGSPVGMNPMQQQFRSENLGDIGFAGTGQDVILGSDDLYEDISRLGMGRFGSIPIPDINIQGRGVGINWTGKGDTLKNFAEEITPESLERWSTGVSTGILPTDSYGNELGDVDENGNLLFQIPEGLTDLERNHLIRQNIEISSIKKQHQEDVFGPAGSWREGRPSVIEDDPMFGVEPGYMGDDAAMREARRGKGNIYGYEEEATPYGATVTGPVTTPTTATTGQTAGQITGQTGTGQIVPGTGQIASGTGQMGTGQMGTGTSAGTGASIGAFGDYTPDFDPSLLTYFTPEQQFQQYLIRTTAPGSPLQRALSSSRDPLLQQYYLTAGGMDTRYGGAGDPRSFEEVLQGQRLTPQDLQSLAQEAAMYGGMSPEELGAASIGQGIERQELNRRLALQGYYSNALNRQALAQTLATQRGGGGFYGGVFGDAIRSGIADLQTVYQSQNPLGGDAGNFLNYYLQQTGAGTMAPPVVNNITGQITPTAPMTPVAPTPQMPNVPLGSAAGAASGLMTDDSTRNEILKQMEKANEAARAAAQTTTQQASTTPAQTTASVAPATTTTATTDAATTAAAQQAAAAAAAQQAAADQAAQQAAQQQAAAAAAAANPIVAPATKPVEQQLLESLGAGQLGAGGAIRQAGQQDDLLRAAGLKEPFSGYGQQGVTGVDYTQRTPTQLNNLDDDEILELMGIGMGAGRQANQIANLDLAKAAIPYGTSAKDFTQYLGSNYTPNWQRGAMNYPSGTQTFIDRNNKEVPGISYKQGPWGGSIEEEIKRRRKKEREEKEKEQLKKFQGVDYYSN